MPKTFWQAFRDAFNGGRAGIRVSRDGTEALWCLKASEFETLVEATLQGLGWETCPGARSLSGRWRFKATDPGAAIGRRVRHVLVAHGPEVGPEVIEEAWGGAEPATPAIVVSSGYFSDEALEAARARGVELVNGDALAGMILRARTPQPFGV